MEISGIAGYLVLFATFAGVYAVLALGLNLQWGFAGQFNFGIAAFFAVGAYTSAILTLLERVPHTLPRFHERPLR